MKRIIAMAALSFTLSAYAQDVEPLTSAEIEELRQVTEYLTREDCFWPDFANAPNFKVCLPDDMRKQIAAGGVGWNFDLWRSNGSVALTHTEPYSERIHEDLHIIVAPARTAHRHYRMELTLPPAGFWRINREWQEAINGYGARVYIGPLTQQQVEQVVAAFFRDFGISRGALGVNCTDEWRDGLPPASRLFRAELSGFSVRRTWDGPRLELDDPRFILTEDDGQSRTDRQGRHLVGELCQVNQ